MVKEKVVITLMTGEMFWEFGRFAPHVIWKRHKVYKDPNIKFIVCTRPERFDIYGTIADIFVPLKIEGDGIKYIAECFRLLNFPLEYHQELVKSLYEQFKDRYDILEMITPDVENRKNFLDKNYYPKDKIRFQYSPREQNKKLIDEYFKDNSKPIVVIAPRYRYKMKRNWPHWQDFYELILKNKLHHDFNFVICGKNPDYVPDSNFTMIDINNIETDNDSSLIGLTMEVIKRSVLTVGSQSAIPNISLLLGTEVLEWGNQRGLHTVIYNVFNTKVTFLDDPTFNISPEVVFKKLNEILNKKKGEIRNAE